MINLCLYELCKDFIVVFEYDGVVLTRCFGALNDSCVCIKGLHEIPVEEKKG